MHGACLCGGVTFRADPPLRDVKLCHCTQCRKTSGHFWAATSVPHDRFHLSAQNTLVWFRSSATAQRGFCGRCGASLFWQPEGEDRIAIAAGSLNGPSGLTVMDQLFLEDAGDYYAPEGPPPAQSHSEILTGGCLCGANHFAAPGPMGEVTACHCMQCRKLSGHFAASFDVREDRLTWTARNKAEFRTPGGGQRGFCPACGSSLYFRALNGDFSVEAGVIDNPTGGHLTGHIFTAFKGDYYELTDGLPQSPGGRSATEGTQA